MSLLSRILHKFKNGQGSEETMSTNDNLSLHSSYSGKGLKRSPSDTSLVSNLSSPDPCKEDLPVMKLTDTFREIKHTIMKQEQQHHALQIRKEKLLVKMKRMDEKVRDLSQRKDELEMELKRIERKQSHVQKELSQTQGRFSEMADKSRKLEKEISEIWNNNQSHSCNDPSLTIEGHQTAVISVALEKLYESQDMYRMASGARDGMIRLWSITSNPQSQCNVCENILRGHRGWVKALHFDSHATGFLLSGGGGDCNVRMWNLSTNSCVSALKGHSAGITCLTSDQLNIYSSSVDKTIRSWDKVTGRCLARYRGHEKYVKSISLSASNQMTTAGGDDHIRIWDIKSGKVIRTLLHIGGVNALCQTENYLYSGGRDGYIHKFDLRMGEVTDSIKASAGVSRMHLNNSILTFATSSPPTVFQYDLQSKTMIRELTGHSKELTDIAVADEVVVSSSWDETIKLYPTVIRGVF